METRAWLLDLYTDPQDELVVWFVTEEGGRFSNQPRLRLKQPFPITFYIAGPSRGLDQARRYLETQPVEVRLEETTRHDLFAGCPIPVLAVQVVRAHDQSLLFHNLADRCPNLTYYDADIPLALRYAARYNTFSLAHCRVTYSEDYQLQDLQVLSSPWELDPLAAPLRILSLEPDVNPSHAVPRWLNLYQAGRSARLDMRNERPLLINLRAILESYDPDLLVTTWGDTWLLAELQRLSRRWRIPLPLNRDRQRGLARRGERSYFSYGRVIYRGEQIHLYGRWHLDRCNAMLWGDYGLDGVLELGRVTRLPIQVAARVSPGTGISSMQILTALHQGVLVPWHKQQAEEPRGAVNLFYADQGGLVYQPTVGLHRDVAEVDFISMYPSVMVRFNISPETVGPINSLGTRLPNAEPIPELGLSIDRTQVGLVPRTLRPLLEKRIALKQRMADLSARDPRRKRYQAYASCHKWLLVTCFGYLGYKNARFGRIEAHQAVTAYGREALLRAKEVAEAQDYEVLHLFVDGMWVKKPGARRVADFQPLLDRVVECTGLPLSLDGIYRWVAFLPSRVNGSVPVPNRYFGVFQDGSIKVRGIEARREDTPPFIARMQMAMLEIMAQATDADALPGCLPDLLGRLRGTLLDLRAGRLPLGDCLVTQKLSRKLDEYRTPSPVARAVAQLRGIGKEMRPGQRVRFLFIRGEPGVWAWDLPEHPPASALDVSRYSTLMLRAASTVFYPLGVSEETLRQWLLGRAIAMALPGGVGCWAEVGL
jgi:DNA polymerase-2